MNALSAIATHGPYDGGFHPWFLFFPLGFILFWVFVIVVVRLAFWGRRGPRAWGPSSQWGGADRASAEHTLASRFAAGDIDEQEYRARLEVLRASPPGP